MSRRKISGVLLSLLVTAPFLLGGSPQKDIVETAMEAGTFNTLLSACETAGLLEELKVEGPVTLLAPSDGAFERLPAGTLERLLQPENHSELRAVLSYHIVPTKMSTEEAATAMKVASLEGDYLRFWSQDGKLKVGNASVITADIPCSNGTIHMIDRVLMPPEIAVKVQTTAD